MKNFMRRTVAFMLMACLLLSVMAPTAFAMTTPEANADTGVITYDIDASSFLGTSTYKNLVANTDLGHFTYLAKGSGNSNTRAYTDDTNGYRININTFQKSTVVDGVTTESPNRWIALKFSVAKAGKYDLAVKGSKWYVDIVVEKYDETKTYDDAYVAALTADGTHADPITYTFDKADYVIFFKANYENAGSYNMNHCHLYYMTLTPIPVATVETKYDFTNLGALFGAAAGGHAYFIPVDKDGNEVLDAYQELYDAGKINYMPYAERSGEVSGDVYAENGKYQYGIFGQFNGVGGFFALKISDLAVGTYEFSASMYTGYANTTSKGQVYVIPVSDVEAVMTASQVTASDAIYNLIQGDYAGKQIVEGSFRTATLTGTAKIESEEDHIVVFYAAALRANAGTSTTAWVHVKDFSLTQTVYDVASTLATTDKFDTVKLNENVNVGTLNIGTGATLDLNGNALTGTVNVTDGNLIDSVGTGAITGSVNVAPGNDALPLKDGNVYRLYNVTKKQNGYKVEGNTLKFWFDLDMAEDVYAKVAAGNFTIGAELTVGGVEVEEIIDLSDAVTSWLTNKGVYESGDGCLWIQLTGLETVKAGTDIVLTPVFENTTTGVSGMFGEAITYTVPAATE